MVRGLAVGATILGFTACFALGACSSEPIQPGGDGAEGGAPDGSAGASGSASVPVRDYSDSPCYGQALATSVYDGETHETVRVPATCRAEGDGTLVYVADELFGTRVSQAAVNRFLHRFEIVGSPHSSRPGVGVLATNQAVFGALDATRFLNGKLPIFLIDSQGGGQGYLCGWCTHPELHLDAVALAPLDGDEALSIAAHETFHVIHRALDPDETIWVDETIAEAAMAVNGFYTDADWFADFVENPNVNWGPATTNIASFHYGAGLAFGTFLWERGGEALLRAITAEPRNGWAGLDAALAATGAEGTGLSWFLDMAVALHFDDPDNGHGFKTFDLPQPIARIALSEGTASGRIQPYGLVYRTVPSSGGTLTVSGDPEVQAVFASDADPSGRQALTLGAAIDVIDSGVLILTATSTAAYTVQYSR